MLFRSAEKKQPESVTTSSVKSVALNPFSAISKRLHDAKEKQVIDEQLKEVEKEQSDTRCEEIPYYDRSLVFTERYECKDLAAYSILKRRNKFYFGVTRLLRIRDFMLNIVSG